MVPPINTADASTAPATVLLYGRAGCGKGTQAALLKQYLEEQDKHHKTLAVETGAAFRAFTSSDSYTGKVTKKVLDEGGVAGGVHFYLALDRRLE